VELEALQREGLGVWLLSGDAPERVTHTARALGIPPENARASQSPEQKGAAVAALDASDTLYLGDGVNDSLAFARAFSAGTPAIDKPVMPARSDFFLLGEGLAPLRAALHASRRLRRVVRWNLAIALSYNALAIAACLSGAMTPLRAAIAMPLSSLTILLFTARVLARPMQGGRP
jgi:Cu2+-exporting ATPase